MGRAVDEEPLPWGRPGEPVGLDFKLGVAGHLLSGSFLLPYLISFIYGSHKLFPLPGWFFLYFFSKVTGSSSFRCQFSVTSSEKPSMAGFNPLMVALTSPFIVFV